MAAKVQLPSGEVMGTYNGVPLIRYRADQMHAYSDAVLAAERVTAAHWQALAEANLKLLQMVRDCRTCAHFEGTRAHGQCYADICTDADRYEPLPPVKLWRTEK